MNEHDDVYASAVRAPFGWLGVRIVDGAVTCIDVLPQRPPTATPTALARRVSAQLKAYLNDPRVIFDVPLDMHGTPYQRRVWRALQRIRPGRVVTYGELAGRLDSGPRAIGGACRANPIPIIVPCHRVVAGGGIGGFMGHRGGAALDIKQWLLAHERGR
jgi:methylated-DNA-[protein]-cysteine S-methyltransferase